MPPATDCVSPPRVAYLVNQYPKISHTFIRDEIAALAAAGTDVLRIAVRGWDAELVDGDDRHERAATRYLLGDGIHPPLAALTRALVAHPVRTSRALALALRLARGGERGVPHHLIYLAEACLAKEWTDRHGSAHVHAHFGSNAATVAMLLRALGGPPFSFTIHGPEEFDKPYQLKLREKIAAAAFTVCISSFGRSQACRFADVADWPRIHVVHCGLGRDYLDAGPLAPVATRRLVCVGRLCEQKAQLVLVRAAAILAARGIDAEVVLVGDGEMRGAVEAEIAAHGLGERVTIAGWQDAAAIRAILAGARGLVLPSFAEGLPVVIMEAMALGRPAVSTYVAGIPELVRDGENGFLVTAGCEDALADAMARLLDLDAATLAAMGHAAHARVADRHDAVTEAGKLARLIAGAPSPRER